MPVNMSGMPVSGPRTTTVKTKYIWLIFVIFLILFALGPVFYYTNSLAVSTPPTSLPPPTTPAPTNTISSKTGGGVSCVSPCDCPNPCTIIIQNSIFGTGALAGKVIIAAGTTVTWANHDGTSHTSTSDTGVWASKILSPGNTFSFTFTTPGTYTYHCQIHPMTGTVVVV